jgi:hypothetical protein
MLTTMVAAGYDPEGHLRAPHFAERAPLGARLDLDLAALEQVVQAADAVPAVAVKLEQHVVALRRAEPALEVGRFELVESEGEVLACIRRSGRGESDFLIALNLDARPGRVNLRKAWSFDLPDTLSRPPLQAWPECVLHATAVPSAREKTGRKCRAPGRAK